MVPEEAEIEGGSVVGEWGHGRTTGICWGPHVSPVVAPLGSRPSQASTTLERVPFIPVAPTQHPPPDPSIFLLTLTYQFD